MSLKRVRLHAVIATIVLAALIGIYVFLFGNFGKTEAKILFTTLTVCYYSMTSLACAAAYEKNRPLLSMPGLALGVIGFLLFIPAIWGEWFENEGLAKTMGVVAVLAFSFAQACLLSLAHLERGKAWVFYAAVASIMALAAIISATIVFEPRDEQWIVRLIGVVAILDASFSLCVPILSRLGEKQAMQRDSLLYDRIELVCPRCGTRGSYLVGAIKCGTCALAIRVQIGAEGSW